MKEERRPSVQQINLDLYQKNSSISLSSLKESKQLTKKHKVIDKVYFLSPSFAFSFPLSFHIFLLCSHGILFCDVK